MGIKTLATQRLMRNVPGHVFICNYVEVLTVCMYQHLRYTYAENTYSQCCVDKRDDSSTANQKITLN